MELIADKLLRGALDMHAHSYPELTLSLEPRIDNFEWARIAKDYGMRGFVMKSHIWPTVMQAYELRDKFNEIDIFGSITLNYTVGGLNPTSVALAGELGAKVVFMPTWSARNDIDRSGVTLNRIRQICSYVDETIKKENGGITVLDNNGKIKEEVKEILSIAKSYKMVINSGHLSIQESIKLAEEAAEMNVKFILEHPHIPTISANREQQKIVVSLGGVVSHTFVACMPMHVRIDPKEIAKSIEVLGAENTILTSDAFGPWNPPAPELLRMYIASLLRIGISENEITKMVRDNPAKLLNLDIKK